MAYQIGLDPLTRKAVMGVGDFLVRGKGGDRTPRFPCLHALCEIDLQISDFRKQKKKGRQKKCSAKKGSFDESTLIYPKETGKTFFLYRKTSVITDFYPEFGRTSLRSLDGAKV